MPMPKRKSNVSKNCQNCRFLLTRNFNKKITYVCKAIGRIVNPDDSCEKFKEKD